MTSEYSISHLQKAFIEFALANQVLRFGEFTLKSGRTSPYFFNAGLFNSGEALDSLGNYYAKTILESPYEADVIFGPAYKGIPIASATAIALSRSENRHLKQVGYAFNRKEAKTHGEKGLFVGAPVQGKLIIVDDVMTAGTAIGEVMAILENSDVSVEAIVVALDRQETVKDSEQSAVQTVESRYGVPVLSVIKMQHLIAHLQNDTSLADHLPSMLSYREQYGAD